MKFSVFLLTAFFLIVSISCGESKKNHEDPIKETFKQYCALCHGIDGKMQLNGAKDLSLSILELEERIQIIREGKNTMTPFKGILKEDQIKALAEYTFQFKKEE
jgi:mono/diheme cytochrome c family protein